MSALTGGPGTNEKQDDHLDPLHGKQLRRGLRGALISAAMHSYHRRASSANTIWGQKLLVPEQAAAAYINQSAVKCGMLEYHQMSSSRWLTSWCAISKCGLLYMYQTNISPLADQILPLEHATIKGTQEFVSTNLSVQASVC